MWQSWRIQTTTHSAIGRHVFWFNFCNRRYSRYLQLLIEIMYASFMIPIQRRGGLVLGWHHEAFQRQHIAQLENRRIVSNMAAEITGCAQSEDRRIGVILLQQLQEMSSVGDLNRVHVFYSSGTINVGTIQIFNASREIMIFLCFQVDAFFCIFLCF